MTSPVVILWGRGKVFKVIWDFKDWSEAFHCQGDTVAAVVHLQYLYLNVLMKMDYIVRVFHEFIC